MNESFKTDPSLATSARAANESGSYLCASNVTPTAVRFIVSVFLCLLCFCRMSSTQMTCSHFRKNRPKKKTKTGRLPIAHYKQKPAGSDLWPVNRCIPNFYAFVSLSSWTRWMRHCYIAHSIYCGKWEQSISVEKMLFTSKLKPSRSHRTHTYHIF